MQTLQKPEIPPRERILLAARELFYARGIRCVSVDEIAAAAHTNKMTLYRHFESKDLLVVEYLKMAAANDEAVANESTRAHPDDSYAQLRDWIARIGNLFGPDRRGCAIANAAVELPEKDHPARLVVEDYKTRQRDRIVRLCAEAGFVEPERLADEIFLLLEGACINVQCCARRSPGARLVALIYALMDSRPRRPKRK